MHKSYADIATKKMDFSQTWFYRCMGLSFISLFVPLLANLTRGAAGFLILMYISLIVGMGGKSVFYIFRRFKREVNTNKWLVLFALWYSLGVWVNILGRGNGLSDWRLLIVPLVLLITIYYSLCIYRDEAAFRLFQICLILVLGVQSYFTIKELSISANIAREMWSDLQGGWEYGNQGVYASWVILLPVFIWRCFVEKGILRLLLLISAISVTVSATIGSFATPVLLLAIGSCVIIFLSIIFSVKGQKRLVAIFLSATLAIGGVFLYQNTQDNPFFAEVYYRINNLLVDPQGGGYDGQYRDGSRVLLAEISINSFLKAPLFGMGGGSIRYSPYVGGHSSIFDSLGAYGLLGGGGALVGLQLTILLGSLKRYIKNRSWETLLAFTSVLLLIVAGITNPYGDNYPLFLVILMSRPFLSLNK